MIKSILAVTALIALIAYGFLFTSLYKVTKAKRDRNKERESKWDAIVAKSITVIIASCWILVICGFAEWLFT
jgi:heme/copper-type cytochrome/quinol oxidase subunit 2